MRDQEAISLIMDALPRHVFITANGMISRWAWQDSRNRERIFPMLGSMGLAQSIAIGLSVAQRRMRVALINGDGNLLMEPSALLLAGSMEGLDIAHFCLNNSSYHSTGGQPSIARPGLLAKLAEAAGYRESAIATTEEALRSFCAADQERSRFCEVMIKSDSNGEPGRISAACPDLADNFKRTLDGTGGR